MAHNPITYDYTTVEPIPVGVRATKKSLWDGQQWVDAISYRIPRITRDQIAWLKQTFGPPFVHHPRCYWAASSAGQYAVMCEQVYNFFLLKWNE